MSSFLRGYPYWLPFPIPAPETSARCVLPALVTPPFSLLPLSTFLSPGFLPKFALLLLRVFLPGLPRRLSSRSIPLCVFIALHSPSHSCLYRPSPLFYTISFRCATYFRVPLSITIPLCPLSYTIYFSLHIPFLVTRMSLGLSTTPHSNPRHYLSLWIKMCSFPCVTSLGGRKFPSPPVSPHLILYSCLALATDPVSRVHYRSSSEHGHRSSCPSSQRFQLALCILDYNNAIPTRPGIYTIWK